MNENNIVQCEENSPTEKLSVLKPSPLITFFIIFHY